MHVAQHLGEHAAGAGQREGAGDRVAATPEQQFGAGADRGLRLDDECRRVEPLDQRLRRPLDGARRREAGDDGAGLRLVQDAERLEDDLTAQALGRPAASAAVSTRSAAGKRMPAAARSRRASQ